MWNHVTLHTVIIWWLIYYFDVVFQAKAVQMSPLTVFFFIQKLTSTCDGHSWKHNTVGIIWCCINNSVVQKHSYGFLFTFIFVIFLTVHADVLKQMCKQSARLFVGIGSTTMRLPSQERWAVQQSIDVWHFPSLTCLMLTLLITPRLLLLLLQTARHHLVNIYLQISRQ